MQCYDCGTDFTTEKLYAQFSHTGNEVYVCIVCLNGYCTQLGIPLFERDDASLAGNTLTSSPP